MARSRVFIWPCAAFCVAILGGAVATTLCRTFSIGRRFFLFLYRRMFDFHTHCLIPDTACLLSCDALRMPAVIPPSCALSVGLHPWAVDSSWVEKVEQVRSAVCRREVWAIGECGLDKMRGVALELQIEAFRAQTDIADRVGKPVIVHCVRAFGNLLTLRGEYVAHCAEMGREPQPWVVHGFRGKPELAKQLMAKGMLLSFGHRYNVETLRLVFTSGCPFFLETDDSHLPIGQIYAAAARHLGVGSDCLDLLCDPRQTIFRHPAF